MSVGGIIGSMPPKCLQSPLTLQHSQSACTICQRFTANYGYFVTPHVSLVSPLDSLLLGWDLSVTWSEPPARARAHMEWEWQPAVSASEKQKTLNDS